MDLLDLPRPTKKPCTPESSDSHTGEACDGDNGVDDEEDDHAAQLAALLAGEDASAHESGDGSLDNTLRHRADHRRARVVAPEPASLADLRLYHDRDYINACLTPWSGEVATKDPDYDDEKWGLSDDCPRFRQLPEYVEQIAGGSMTAARLLAAGEADIAIFWDGGRHHAHKTRAAGFCYVNDAVLAIMQLKKPRKIQVEVMDVQEDRNEGKSENNALCERTAASLSASRPAILGFGARPAEILRAHAAGRSPTLHKRKEGFLTEQSPQHGRKQRTVLSRLERILYLDLDVHWGDGVDEAFSGSPTVLTISVHNHGPGFYPCPPDLVVPPQEASYEQSRGTIEPTCFNIPLHPGLGEDSWNAVWRQSVLPLLDSYDPEAIVVQCGLDGLAGDPVGQWNLGLHSLASTVSDILLWASRRSVATDVALQTHDVAYAGHADGSQAKRCPVLLLGGGGYDLCNAARGWAALTAIALGRHHLDASGNAIEADDQIARLLSTPIPDSHPRWPEFEERGGAGRDDGGSDEKAGEDGSAPRVPRHNTLDVPSTPRPDLLNNTEYIARIAATSRHVRRSLERSRRPVTRGGPK
ncbi:unnamed protein product [Parajaminaea phylloscopi]